MPGKNGNRRADGTFAPKGTGDLTGHKLAKLKEQSDALKQAKAGQAKQHTVVAGAAKGMTYGKGDSFQQGRFTHEILSVQGNKVKVRTTFKDYDGKETVTEGSFGKVDFEHTTLKGAKKLEKLAGQSQQAKDEGQKKLASLQSMRSAAKKKGDDAKVKELDEKITAHKASTASGKAQEPSSSGGAQTDAGKTAEQKQLASLQSQKSRAKGDPEKLKAIEAKIAEHKAKMKGEQKPAEQQKRPSSVPELKPATSGDVLHVQRKSGDITYTLDKLNPDGSASVRVVKDGYSGFDTVKLDKAEIDKLRGEAVVFQKGDVFYGPGGKVVEVTHGKTGEVLVRPAGSASDPHARNPKDLVKDGYTKDLEEARSKGFTDLGSGVHIGDKVSANGVSLTVIGPETGFYGDTDKVLIKYEGKGDPVAVDISQVAKLKKMAGDKK